MKKGKVLVSLILTALLVMQVIPVHAESPATEAARKIYTINLDKQQYTYTGKAIKPKVTVTYRSGEVFDAKHYKVTYKNNKNVGTATIMIDGIRHYSYVHLSTTFKIVAKGAASPKQMSLTSVKSKTSRQITAKWKRDKTVTGYEIQVSKNKKFTSGVKKAKLKGNKTTYTFKKLAKKKTYYVRIRSYKKTGKAVKYSKWSKVKRVKTK